MVRKSVRVRVRAREVLRIGGRGGGAVVILDWGWCCGFGLDSSSRMKDRKGVI